MASTKGQLRATAPICIFIFNGHLHIVIYIESIKRQNHNYFLKKSEI